MSVSETSGSHEVDGPDAVLVTHTERFHTSVGIAIRSLDLSSNPPELLVRTSSGFTQFTGAPHAGGYRFLGVPQGEFYLKRGSSFVVTDERHVEVGQNFRGREDTVFSSAFDAEMAVNLTNVAPWEDPDGSFLGSRLQLVSGQLDFVAETYLWSATTPGMTHLNGYGLAYNLSNTFPTFDGLKQDGLYVNQFSSFQGAQLPTGAPLVGETISRSLELPFFDFDPGISSVFTLSGAMQSVPSESFSLEWRMGSYPAQALAIHPNATARAPSFTISPAPHSPASSSVGYAGEVLNFTLPAGANFTLTDQLAYGNPYPASWQMVGSAHYPFSLSETAPGASRARTRSGAIASWDTLDNLVASPIEPKLTPAGALAIDGIAATTQRQVSNSSPIITWTPPVTGAPNAYRVLLNRYNVSNASLWIQNQFYLPGTASELRLPAGVLAPGAVYALTVTAIDSPNSDVTREPFTVVEQLPLHMADTLSSFFTTP
ncbi:hypothetical protein [Myxococcus hansupus]|uniref:hypothetical protein n=1 Tax=Pseudomyxococcus hansupus TaxID=1297742 RepID=UPI001D045E91|nr:hypothetical protein [Myxococcus hansupus]